ncbi:putative rhamnogalacturonate lyase [Hordeum vulgare]|nr:putative rhamnogalacturonate lyase [Hordeum vulgare]
MPGIQSMSVLPSSPLAYREAVLLVDPSEPQFKGEVEDKYQYTLDTKDNMVHGWVTAGRPNPVGFWVVTPAASSRAAGRSSATLRRTSARRA